MIEVPIIAEIDTTLVRQMWQGSEVTTPMRDEVQNDPAAWAVILAAVDGADKDRRMVRNLKRQLRPMAKAVELLPNDAGRVEVGKLQVSEEALRFLHGLVDKPPEIQTQRGSEKMKYRGSLIETVGDFEDFYEDWKAEQKKSDKEDDGDKGDSEDEVDRPG